MLQGPPPVADDHRTTLPPTNITASAHFCHATVTPLPQWCPTSLTMPGAYAPSRRRNTRRPRRLPSTGEPPPATPPCGPCAWWPHCERAPKPCWAVLPTGPGHTHEVVGRSVAQYRAPFFRFQFCFPFWNSRNSFRVPKFIENTIQLGKIQIKFCENPLE
jgi:hypothetical protein